MIAGRYRYVAIEGPIGAGKTSLTRRLAQHFNAHTLLERPEANPFLERFYSDRARYALPTQLFFLFQRVQQLADVRQLDMFRAELFADFLLDKDPLFARLTLADDELKLYEQILAQLRPQTPAPDLVIYLQAAPRHWPTASRGVAIRRSRASARSILLRSQTATRGSFTSTTRRRC